MGFIHNHEIPACLLNLLLAFRVFSQPVKSAEYELVVVERIAAFFTFFQCHTTAFIVNSKGQIYPAQHFNQPLVNERVWHDNQNAASSTGLNLLVDNKRSFNGFSQAHFVGQQYAGRVTTAHFRGDVQLMGNKLDTRTHHADSV